MNTPLSALFKRLGKVKYQELKNYWGRKHPGPHQGVPGHGLEENQVYPHGENFIPCLCKVVEQEFEGLSLAPGTPVASIGSCFAEEFAHYMIEKKFNYLETEKSRLGASANWGRVYTIPNLSQIVDYTLDDAYPVVIEKTERRSSKKEEKGWFDPLRDLSPLHRDPEKAGEEIQTHRQASLKVFKEARILVITLGQNEGWHDQTNGLIWAQRPPGDILAAGPDRFTYQTFKQAAIQEQMRNSLTKLFTLNPGMRVILTVSPVPAYATFHKKPVITGSFANKCILRLVAGDIAEEFKGRVHYFPSFEIVLAYNPFSYKADNRHVMYRSLKRIFKVMERGLKIK